jgi:hypothetical protein
MPAFFSSETPNGKNLHCTVGGFFFPGPTKYRITRTIHGKHTTAHHSQQETSMYLDPIPRLSDPSPNKYQKTKFAAAFYVAIEPEIRNAVPQKQDLTVGHPSPFRDVGGEGSEIEDD